MWTAVLLGQTCVTHSEIILAFPSSGDLRFSCF